jgi:hypothetical protein
VRPVTGAAQSAPAKVANAQLDGREPTGLQTLGSVGTVIGRRGRVYVSQVVDDVRIGGDTVTGVTGIVHK